MTDRQYTHLKDDPSLLARVANGDKLAFEQLYERYEGSLAKYVFFITRSKEVTEEIIQDIFLRVWQQREKLPALNSFRGFIYRIARNLVISWLRSVKTKHKIVELDRDAPGGSHTDADHQALYNQYYKLVFEAIALLPERKREVFLLNLEEDLTLDEIAGRLNLTKSTVKQHLYSATASLRDYLKKHGNITAALLIWLALSKR